MNNIFEILYKPTTVFERLDKLYEEDLNTDSTFIALIFGAFLGLYICIIQNELLASTTQGNWLILFCLFLVLISSGFCVLLYNYIFTYVLYGIGKLLGSKGVVADTRTSIVYSLIPGFINFFVLFSVKYISDLIQLDYEVKMWTLRVISFIFWAWTMIILVTGLKILNKYSVEKAIMNLLPLFAIGLAFLLFSALLR